MTRPIKDEHSREDNVTPVTSLGNAHVTNEDRVAIQYFNNVSDGYNAICTYR